MKRAEFKCQDGKAEVYIYDVIGSYWGEGISADQFREDIEALGDITQLTVRIHSPGGAAFDGLTMYNALRRLAVPTVAAIDGVAASAAAILAMGADRVVIAETAQIMIHEAMCFAEGRAADHRAAANRLDSINDTHVELFASKSGELESVVSAWLDDETWFTAAEALATGLADEISEKLLIAACIPSGLFKKTPVGLEIIEAQPEGKTAIKPKEKGRDPLPFSRRLAESWLLKP